MILVTAATGQVGRAALDALTGQGTAVRALVRNPADFAAPPGIEVAGGDFDDEASLEVALRGVTTLFLAGRDSPRSVAQHRRVLAHAARAGVLHVVKLSAIGAKPSSPVALMREHHAVDEMVRAGPGGWTLLQPHLFMQNLLRAADTIRSTGRLSAPMGHARFPLVDTDDVGAAAAAVLRDPAPHTGKRYALTGPAAVTYGEIAAEFQRVAGRPVAYDPFTPEAFEARLRVAGMPDWRAFDLAHIAAAYSSADHAVTGDLAVLLGRAPTALSAFAERNRSLFRDA